MLRTELHRILVKRHPVTALLRDVEERTGDSVRVAGLDGSVLYGDPDGPLDEPGVPVELNGAVLGYCHGPGAEVAASLLTAFARESVLRRGVGAETLSLYREVNLLYDLAEKLADANDVQLLGEIVIDEAQRLLENGSGAVWLLRDETRLEVVSSVGEALDHPYEVGVGVIGAVVKRRTAELIDDVQSDGRATVLEDVSMALICAPLKTSRRCLGCIALGGPPGSFTSGHLKLLNAIASMAAPAFEGVLTRTEKLREVEERERQARQDQEIRHLREINQMKDEVVRMASHDLKTPISQIRGYAEVLREEGFVTGGEASEVLGRIELAAHRMNELVTNLLDLARIESEEMAFDAMPTALDLGECLRAIVDTFALEAQRRDIALLCEPAPMPVHLWMPAARVHQVVTNLLANALKYTPDGGEVELFLERTPDRRVHIHVRDNGVGIPTESLPRLFDRFFRVDHPDHRAREGTGLGLAIVAAIVSQNGGTIDVESEVGVGTLFSVHIPEAPADDWEF